MEPRTQRHPSWGPGSGLLTRALAALALLCAAIVAVSASVSSQCRVPDEYLRLEPGLPAVAAAIRDSQPVKILLVGSKISGPGETERRGEKLQAELERRLPGAKIEIEAGGTGAFMAQVQFDRIRSDLDHIQPTLIIWQAGFAEALGGTDPEEFEADLKEAAHWILERGIDLVFVDPPYVGGVEHESSYWPVVERISAAGQQAGVNVFRRYAATQFLASGTDLRAGKRGCVPELLAEAISLALGPR